MRVSVIEALEACGWSLYAAARELGCTPRKLQSVIESKGLSEMYREKTGNRSPGWPRQENVSEEDVLNKLRGIVFGVQ